MLQSDAFRKVSQETKWSVFGFNLDHEMPLPSHDETACGFYLLSDWLIVRGSFIGLSTKLQ